jgi:radical SAM superfamily enzyme YgiQ (UPF0313 family)
MTVQKKVALVAMPRQDLLRPPPAIPILAAACEELNVDYDFYDLNLWLYKNMDRDLWQQLDDNWIQFNSGQHRDQEYFQIFLQKIEQFIDIMLSDNVNFFAISVFTNWSAHCTLELITALANRPERDQITIAIGGTGIQAHIDNIIGTPAMLCEWALENKLIDYYLYGEGEQIFRELLKDNISEPGINNYNTVQIENLDQYPSPSYKKIDPYQYNYISWPELAINGSRGCVRKCTYCDVARYWPKYRFRSGESIANELYHTWKTTKIHSFEFTDSLINGSLREFRLLNKTLIKLQQQDPDFRITYKGQFICRSQKQFTEQDYREMKQAGCNYLYVGVETFSERVRYEMDKKFTNEDLDFHLLMCGRYNIPNVFLMITGYPTETEEDHKLNIEGLKKYQVYALAGIINLITFGYTTSILEDTPLERMQHQLSIVKEFDNFDRNNNWISLKNPKLTFKERVKRWIELVELAHKLNYSQPRLETAISTLSESLVISKTKKVNKLISLESVC